MALPSMSKIVSVVTEAGEIARGHFRNVVAERKVDRTLVTRADREVEEFLVRRLSVIAPAARILGEEFGVAGKEDAGCTLTLDPIDGTSAFVAGLPTWCVTVGLICDGRALGGVTHLPVTGDTYVAEDGVGRWNGRVISPDRHGVSEGDVFMVSHSDLHRTHAVRFPGKVRAFGSTAYHMALVARGAAVAALLGRARIWDIAAGAALLAATGGELRHVSGEPVDLEALLGGERTKGYLVAAASEMIDEILSQIEAPK